MTSNRIAQIKTVEVEDDAGPLTAIMIAVDVNDPRSAQAFAREIAQAFKSQRTLSPPDTAGLLITVIGALSADDFAAHWQDLVKEDQILAHFMKGTRVADVIQGTRDGRALSRASLLTN